MNDRRSDYDVTNTVQVTDPVSVCLAIRRLYTGLYPDASVAPLKQACLDMTRLFQGEYPGYLACDTPYHDLQHSLDVSLAMARLISGYENAQSPADRLGASLAATGIITAMFHDAGYVRRRMDRIHASGAEYTHRHVSRSGRFLAAYLPRIGMQDMVPLARKLVHFTGHEISVPAIPLRDEKSRVLGNLLGTADLLAQMSDRCYLEKCRDRLYPEFVAAGLAGGYVSAEELVYQTPHFFRHAHERLNHVLQGMYRHAGSCFFPERNLYMEALEANRSYLETVVEKRDMALLRRRPPSVPVCHISREMRRQAA
ncbi:MAG: hypothetical protein Q9M29_01165 [Mariprofundaceae bacterium]|nr:hypothetical protein [Mariprofundaceae bacterium]